MPDAITKLLEIGSAALGPLSKFNGQHGVMRSYLDLLEKRNGFYAFESALLVRPGFLNGTAINDSRAWNNPNLWKAAYESLQPKAFFFAEDVFGNQFGIASESIVRFDAETAEIDFFAHSMDEWADKILQNFSLHTGHPIARDWQTMNGPLEVGKRLLFKQPLVLGGKIDVDNLICWDDVRAMRARGALAEQLKDVPDGGQIIFNYTD